MGPQTWLGAGPMLASVTCWEHGPLSDGGDENAGQYSCNGELYQDLFGPGQMDPLDQPHSKIRQGPVGLYTFAHDL